jgi:glutamine synthetase
VTMEIKSLVQSAVAAGVQLVRFEYCDFSGVARCKAVHVSQLAHKLTEGVGLTRAQMSINLLERLVHIEGMEPVGEIRLVPDPDTYSSLPWAPGSASVLCDQLDHDRRDWGACPRSLLKRVVKRAADRGIHVQAAFENEYYLARPVDGNFVPFDAPGHAPVYSSIGHDHHAAIMAETVRSLESQNMIVEAAINEYGPGQQEISVRHAGALQSADNQMKFRDAVRGVALNHNLVASFAPKPYPDQIGSGAHIHFSLWDPSAEKNVLFDANADRCLSALGRSFIAGVAAHLPALVALTAPSYNSYRRLQPAMWASATTAWGFDNKEAALRVVSPYFQRERQTYNIEFKTSDASANPYISLAGLITCGLDGIDRGLQPGEPCEHDPARLSAEQLDQAKVRQLPRTLGSALDELEKDELLRDVMGSFLFRSYLKVKRSEQEAFDAGDTAFEIAAHFYKF